MIKVFIKTYGCSFNVADSEQMAGLLESSERYEIVQSEEEADVIIVNSCTVKNSAENKFWRDIKKSKKKIIMAGCVPQAEKNKQKFMGYSVIGTNQIDKVVGVVDETLHGNTVQLFKKKKSNRLILPKVKRNSIVEIVPINEGCLGSCNFCATKFARGHLHSYPITDIVKHIRNGLNEGAKEIWLTSQDTACYGYDRKKTIVDLMKAILQIERNFKLRLGMGNPDFLPDYLPEYLDVIKDPRTYQFLHIPVQAGSQRVLDAMKREYTKESFIDIVTKCKERYPQMTIATDIICGYPDETDDDFKETLDLMKELQIPVINISRFWPRPGTLAAKKKALPSEVVKARSIQLKELHEQISLSDNQKWMGWKGKVLISEQKQPGSYVARNFAYKPVIVKGEYQLGDEVDVKIVEAKTHHLIGAMVE